MPWTCLALWLVTLVLGGPGTQVPGRQLQSRVSGEGFPVVLLGGGLLGADGWAGVPRLLARDHRVINLQSLAVQYGLEDRPLPGGYSIQMEVDALARSFDSMHVAKADVIGMSHGAVIALIFAFQNQGRVRTLTLIEPPAFWILPNHGHDDQGARKMQDLVQSFRDRPIGEEDVERFRCALDDCLWVKYRRSLRALHTVPTLVVTGAGTVPFHRAINVVLLKLLPRAQPLDLPGGHNSPVTSPEQFVTSWQRFSKRAE